LTSVIDDEYQRERSMFELRVSDDVV